MSKAMLILSPGIV